MDSMLLHQQSTPTDKESGIFVIVFGNECILVVCGPWGDILVFKKKLVMCPSIEKEV